jgi:hypothetical protein
MADHCHGQRHFFVKDAGEDQEDTLQRCACMASDKTPIRSRRKCPSCGGPLYYVDTRFSFFTGAKKRMCLAPDCGFVEHRRFKVGYRKAIGGPGQSPPSP